MNLTAKDLKQIDEEYLLSLSQEQLLDLSKKLLDDLRSSHDRLNMNAENSSCPSGSLPHWWKATNSDSEADLERDRESESIKAEKSRQAKGWRRSRSS